MKTIFLVNPVSGGRLRKMADIITKAMLDSGHTDNDYALEETHAENPDEQAAKACERSDLVIAVGGDGTIHSMVAGYIKAGRPDIRLGIYPAGTGNDLFRHLYGYRKFKNDPIAYIKGLLTGTVYNKGIWKLGDHRWMNYVSLGFDAEISDRFDKIRRKARGSRLRNYLRYIRISLFSLNKKVPDGIILKVENEDITARKNLLISAISSYAAGARIPRTETDIATVVAVDSIWGYCRLMSTRMLGEPNKKLKYQTMKRGLLRHSGEGVLQIDGETLQLADMPRELSIEFEGTIPFAIPQE